jgi:protein involved in polysaccharide export with SLBB domain
MATAVGLCLALALGCSAPPLAEPAALAPDRPVPSEVRQRLVPDDVVLVQVYGHPELSTGELGRRVDYDGNLDLPLVGALPVVGRTVSEARALVQEALLRYVKEASVSIAVVEYAPRLFHVLGEVATSGAYELRGPTTALQALTKAGGLTRLADRDEIVLLRVVADELEVHSFSASTPDPRGLFPVQPGDLLFVRESGSGTFQQAMLPYLQGLAPPFAAAASLFLVADNASD